MSTVGAADDGAGSDTAGHPDHPEIEPFLSYSDLPPFGRADYGFYRRRFGRLD